MTRSMLFCLTGAFVAASAVLSAQERAPLGNSNFAMKLDYIAFTDGYFDDAGNEDDGLYYALEGFGKIAPNLYLGGEIGTGFNINLGGEHISLVPVELNLKYAKETSRRFVMDFGAGFSYSFAEVQYHRLFSATDEKRDDWLLGAQVFADLTYKFNRLFIGFNGKYQVTEDFTNESIHLSNYRLGLQLGFLL